MEYVRLVLHMEVYHSSKEQREMFLDRLWNIRIGHTEKKLKIEICKVGSESRHRKKPSL